jgi:hypothetical protein
MKLFGLLKSPKVPAPVSGAAEKGINRHASGIRTLENLSFDLQNISKSDFVEIGDETTSKGNRYKRYMKSLVRTELDMFNEIELLEFDSGESNLYLKAPVSNIKLENLSHLVESLHSELGEDMFGNTSFDTYDKNSVNRSFWTGRYWNKSKPRISIKLMNDCLELSVLGIRK